MHQFLFFRQISKDQQKKSKESLMRVVKEALVLAVLTTQLWSRFDSLIIICNYFTYNKDFPRDANIQSTKLQDKVNIANICSL